MNLIKRLPKGKQLVLLWAIIDFGFDEKEPNLTEHCADIFAVAKPLILANNRHYEDGCKGGRPRKITQGFLNSETNDNYKDTVKNNYKGKYANL